MSNKEETSVFEKIRSLKDKFTQLAMEALQDGLAATKEAKESGRYIGKFYDYPTLSFKKNGLPTFSSYSDSGPIEYTNCFHSYSGEPLVDPDKIESFDKLIDFVKSDENLRKRFALGDESSAKNLDIDDVKIYVMSRLKECIERYIHSGGAFEFDESKASNAISPMVTYVFDERLSIDIHVPILFLTFDFDGFEITENIWIERISQEEHLSRYKVKSHNISASRHVVYSATHALVLKDWYVPNTERSWDFGALSDLRAYPIKTIDNFFGSLRICSSGDTGYAQIYSVAKGWAVSSTAHLPCIKGVTTRNYPSYFEDFQWNVPAVPLISNECISEVKTIFSAASSAKQNSIALSINRLNRCMIRDDEADAVLDATIALESLLSDDGKQEMTHKLALRVGALSKLDKSLKKTPQQAFKDVKKVYGHRSAIVHGSKNLDKSRIIKIDEDRSTTAQVLAIEYVKMVLRVLLKNDKYRNPLTIDSDLLLGR